MSARIALLWVTLSAAVVAGGCAGLCRPGGVGAARQGDAAGSGASEVGRLLAYAAQLQALPAQGLQDRWQEEAQRVEARLRAHPDGTERLRLALLLTLPGTPADDDRARALLQDYLGGPVPPPAAMGNLARWLLHDIDVREAQYRRLRAAQARSEALQHKIDELLNIEQSIDRRPKAPVPEGGKK